MRVVENRYDGNPLGAEGGRRGFPYLGIVVVQFLEELCTRWGVTGKFRRGDGEPFDQRPVMRRSRCEAERDEDSDGTARTCGLEFYIQPIPR